MYRTAHHVPEDYDIELYYTEIVEIYTTVEITIETVTIEKWITTYEFEEVEEDVEIQISEQVIFEERIEEWKQMTH